MRSFRSRAVLFVLVTAASCKPQLDDEPSHNTLSSNAAVAVESGLAAVSLAKVKAALPKVAFPGLQEILTSPQTYWYDHESMKPSYQAAVKGGATQPGANSNDRWLNLLAPGEPQTIGNRNFYDGDKKRWKFPFGTTAGTDESTNLKVVNFLWLPAKSGSILPLVTYPTEVAIANLGDLALLSWGWRYPVGATLGEVLMVTGSSGEWLPSEIRTRTRYAKGWAVNVFRPFPTATSLAQAIKKKRPSWRDTSQLSTLVSFLENTGTLTAKRLTATNLPGTFDQAGSLDVLPDFGDAGLVKELLTQTIFVSSYKTAWKTAGDKTSFAAASNAPNSIVPINYDGGLIAVDEKSCMRCHQDTGRGLTTFDSSFTGIVLYGEMWGRDGIFSFHPYDESKYSVFKAQGNPDNRAHNPKLKQQGLLADYSSSVHIAPNYPTEEIGLGKAGATGPAATDTDKGTDKGTGTRTNNSNIIEFRIPAGTGAGEWNTQGAPVVIKAGGTIHIVNDDAAEHTMHTNSGVPCPHQPQDKPMKKGEFYDCAIPSSAASGTEYMLWDHVLGGPGSGRFWIKVQ